MSKARNLADLLNASGQITAEDIGAGAAVPVQTGQSGKYLTTDGTDASWAAIVQTSGMFHALDTDNSGNLTWTAGATDILDADGNDIHETTIIGTSDMAFYVDDNGHLIMTIN
jgi:hypothetical protein